jgi:hypothetical protein
VQRVLRLRRGGAELLNQLVAFDEPPSHERLDGLGPAKRVIFLRGLLTVAGLLEERSEHIARFEQWVDQRTAALPREHSTSSGPSRSGRCCGGPAVAMSGGADRGGRHVVAAAGQRRHRLPGLPG